MKVDADTLLDLVEPPRKPLFGPPAYRDRRGAGWDSGADPFFDPAAAFKVIDFLQTFIHHVKGEKAGELLDLEPWQVWWLSELYGWKNRDGADPAGCSRQYRNCWAELPRKNAKTTIAAGLALYHTLADGEKGGEVYSVASTLEQAAIAFQIAAAMVEKEPHLAERLTIYGGNSGKFKSIEYPAANTFYRVVPSKPDSLHGANLSMFVADEVHAWPVGKDRELWDVLETSQGSRRQPLALAITTAGYDRESLWSEKRDRARAISEGTVEDPLTLVVVYAAPDDADWTAPATWEAANPNFGVSVYPTYLAAKCRNAEESPANQNAFLRLHLNMRTAQHTRWLHLADWDECRAVMPDLTGRSFYAGLDLASTTDLAAFIRLYEPKDGGPWWIVPKFYCPTESIRERTRDDRVPYEEWCRAGYITATEGNVIDYDYIREDIKRSVRHSRMIELAFDRWNAAQISTQLVEDGATVIPFGQGFASMSAPTKRLEVMIREGSIAHDGNPVLRWMIGNVAVLEDPAGNLKPAKNKSAEKIDGVVGLIMAVGRAMLDRGPSVYETGGGLFSVGA